MPKGSYTLRSALGQEMGEWGSSRPGRLLQAIRRDMDIKAPLFRARRRNEEVLSLVYQEGTTMGGGMDWENVRENALNLPYRWNRWMESQATSKKMVVKVSRDAGAGQRPGGLGDEVTGMWLGILLQRVAYMAGFRREIKAVIGEVAARGTSVMRIGFHREAISALEAHEAGKGPQSVVVDALQGGIQAQPGQDHAAIHQGLSELAEDEDVQREIGQEGVDALLSRSSSHIEAEYQDETDDSPLESTRLIRRKVWMQQLRVGEDVGWAPWVSDTEDAPWWWQRHVWSVAEVKAAETLFTPKFRREVEGYDARNVSEVHEGGETPSSETMSADARQAQGEGILDDDERTVEWFEVWFRRPDMRSGGIRKIVAPEMPDEFVELDDTNPHYDEESGTMMIPTFYPYYDFTPVLSTLPVSERTCGIPLLSVAMPQFERVAEYNRLRQEAALKGATRLHQINGALKEAKSVLNAIRNGEIGFAFISDAGMTDDNGKMLDAIKTYDFTGRNPEIDREAEREKLDFLNMVGMPPAIYQGMGTADTAAQDKVGVAAGERESGGTISYFEERMADVLEGMRGLIRYNLDDEDFIRLLGEEGAQVMKAWQAGSVDDGDEISVTFGARAEAEETVAKKQLMEAITLIAGQVDGLGLPLYDVKPVIEELYRRFDLGTPHLNQGRDRQMQELILQLAAQLEQVTGVNPLDPKGRQNGQPGGPNPAEGGGPTAENIEAGARRGTAETPLMAGTPV